MLTPSPLGIRVSYLTVCLALIVFFFHTLLLERESACFTPNPALWPPQPPILWKLISVRSPIGCQPVQRTLVFTFLSSLLFLFPYGFPILGMAVILFLSFLHFSVAPVISNAYGFHLSHSVQVLGA
jgi:hypothetical protein